jgi:hypothetical protein
MAVPTPNEMLRLVLIVLIKMSSKQNSDMALELTEKNIFSCK